MTTCSVAGPVRKETPSHAAGHSAKRHPSSWEALQCLTHAPGRPLFDFALLLPNRDRGTPEDACTSSGASVKSNPFPSKTETHRKPVRHGGRGERPSFWEDAAGPGNQKQNYWILGLVPQRVRSRVSKRYLYTRAPNRVIHSRQKAGQPNAHRRMNESTGCGLSTRRSIVQPRARRKFRQTLQHG